MQEPINNQSMLRVGTVLRGIYHIDSYLSSGGFGNTYVATNIEFEERVAIKEFFMKGVTQRDDNQTTVSVSNTENHNSFFEQREKFKKEARRLRQLNNSHIIRVYDLFEENGTAYYVMDYVDGENLSDRLKRTGNPMTEAEVNEILPQVLDALKTVHDAGIWHLDLKPANIMVDKSGNVKLIDFGASKQLNAQKGGATTSTAISYTNGYAPREQMEQNYDKFGPWTDLYALGATLYNLLTNKRPPLPTDIDDDMSEDKHLALPMPNASDSMKKLILWLMQTNRMKRPKSIEEVLEKLRTLKAAGSNQPKVETKETIIGKQKTMVPEETIIDNSKGNQDKKKNTMDDATDDLEPSTQPEQVMSLPRTDFITAIKYALYEKFHYDLNRSRRSEFWWFVLFLAICIPIISYLTTITRLFGLVDLWLWAGFFFAFIRRVHDSGHSGYWGLICFTPLVLVPMGIFVDLPKWVIFTPFLISAITIIYLGCMDSDKEENDYGESPKYVLVTEDALSDSTDESSWMDRFSEFLSNRNNVVLLIIPLIAIFFGYVFWGRDNQNSEHQKEYTSIYKSWRKPWKTQEQINEIKGKFQNLSDEKYGPATYMLGIMCEDSTLAIQYFEQSLEPLSEQAEKGDMYAQCCLGEYIEKFGTGNNHQEAVKWYLKSANQGFAVAMALLADCYYNGNGIEKDEAKAIEWREKAAQTDDEIEIFQTGICYSQGQMGFPVDTTKAISYYTKAAEKGLSSAKVALGEFYTFKDLKKALEYFSDAAMQKDAGALFNLGCIYAFGKDRGLDINKDLNKAISYYEESLKYGDIFQIRLYLAYCYAENEQAEKAFENFYYQATNYDFDAEAQYRLYECYNNGFGTVKDIKKAKYWKKKALEHGFEE